MIIVYGICFISLFVIGFYLLGRKVLQFNKAFDKEIEILRGKGNSLKGELGELAAFSQLSNQYDRIFYLHNIVDFIGIKLPKEGEEGSIDFVEVKTSSKSKQYLSKDQKLLKALIAQKKINFIQADINIKNIND